MSSVTTVLLNTSGDGEVDAVADLNQRLAELVGNSSRAGFWSLGLISEPADRWGGSKYPPHLYGGALNHLPWPVFCQLVTETGWELPDEVRLIVQRPERDWQVLTLRDLTRAENG